MYGHRFYTGAKFTMRIVNLECCRVYLPIQKVLSY